MVAAALAAAGVAFVGESAVVMVDAGGSAMVNFPFRITMQTIGVGAVMGNDDMTGAPVGGVTLALFPTAQDAEAGTNLLGMGTKTGETGMAGLPVPAGRRLQTRQRRDRQSRLREGCGNRP